MSTTYEAYERAREEAARVCDTIWQQDVGTAGAGSSATCAISIRALPNPYPKPTEVMTIKIPPSKIESIKQSPLNALRWCLQLDCGHDQWMTAKHRPTRLTIRCERCAEKAVLRT